MIRYLRLLFLGLLGLCLLVIALANRAPVSVRLLPEDLAALTGLTWAMELPLFLVIFAGIVAGGADRLCLGMVPRAWPPGDRQPEGTRGDAAGTRACGAEGFDLGPAEG